MLRNLLVNLINNKNGIEIGGPSPLTGEIIYKYSNKMDNVVYSKHTIWNSVDENVDDYYYYDDKKGKLIINDSTNIYNVPSESYDFCFSSHCLEHIANPMKALSEWIRITKIGGYIILILPEKSVCFDHNREYSSFSTLLRQYEKNVGEDDLSTLPEILMKHDLSMDPPAGTFEEFKNRSLNNFNNRCLHHYVYNEKLLLELCNYFRCRFIFTTTHEINIWFIMQKIN
jgi:SAM-dependent methyltransferase